LNYSITQKIGGLSTILLSFLLVVILYSVYKLDQIDREMREVAQIDIPLTELTSDIELLQLEQHLWMEKLREKKSGLIMNGERADFSERFNRYSRKLAGHFDRLVRIIQTGLSSGRIRLKIETHRSMIQTVTRLHDQRIRFETHVHSLSFDTLNKNSREWVRLEEMAARLDEQVEGLLKDMGRLAEDIAGYAEKHEREFMLINATLGVSAICIGFYLTICIIQTFRRRIDQIQGKIQSLQHSVSGSQPLDPNGQKKGGTGDELSTLENALEDAMARLSNEFANRDEAEQKLMELATRDKLTGAWNRHKWDEQIRVELNLAERGSKLGMVLIDVDRFKLVNDRFGHDVGDEVLRLLVSQMTERLRAGDQVFRLGGEEFAVLLRHIGKEGALALANALRSTIENFSHGNLPGFTISAGVTLYRNGDDAATLVKRADQALYRAKENGRNRVIFI